jgi:hypothetical protein
LTRTGGLASPTLTTPMSSENTSVLARLLGALAEKSTAPALMAKVPPRWASVAPPVVTSGRTVAMSIRPIVTESWSTRALLSELASNETAPLPTLIEPLSAAGPTPARGPT